jgi:hypothetical protein
MPDKGKKFHEFALKSILFKGRGDWYFCYLKAERIAHVLAVLEQKGAHGHALQDILHDASALPQTVARLAAGELEPAFVLADVFGLLSGVRLASTQGAISTEQAFIIAKEYEGLAERLMQGSHPSPFISAEDFYVPELSTQGPFSLPQAVKDIKDNRMSFSSKGQNEGESDRASRILQYIKEKKSASIKDIAAVVRDCSEKTIQRELTALIDKGLIKRIGERRWSQYLPA